MAELTKFGWILVSPGQGVQLSQMFLTQTSSVEYEELCRMDVLGLAGDQEAVYEEFKEQLSRNPEGWYESGLPWKGYLFPSGTNEANSQRRLRTLVPEPTARSAVRRGLLIPLGYLHPGKSEHSEVKSPSMIAGTSLWFVVHGWSSH